MLHVPGHGTFPEVSQGHLADWQEGNYTSPLHQTGDVAELADALDLGSSSFIGVQVQILSSPLFYTSV